MRLGGISLNASGTEKAAITAAGMYIEIGSDMSGLAA